MSSDPWLVLEDESSMITRMYRRMAKKGKVRVNQWVQRDGKYCDVQDTSTQKVKNQSASTETEKTVVPYGQDYFDDEHIGTIRQERYVHKGTPDHHSIDVSNPKEVYDDERATPGSPASFSSFYDLHENRRSLEELDYANMAPTHYTSTVSASSHIALHSQQFRTQVTGDSSTERADTTRDSLSYDFLEHSWNPDEQQSTSYDKKLTSSIAEPHREQAPMDSSSSKHYFTFFDHYCSSKSSSTSQLHDNIEQGEAWDGFDFSSEGASSMSQTVQSAPNLSEPEVTEQDESLDAEERSATENLNEIDISSSQLPWMENVKPVSGLMAPYSRKIAAQNGPVVAMNRNLPKGTTIADMRMVIERSLSGSSSQRSNQPSSACKMIDLSIPKSRSRSRCSEMCSESIAMPQEYPKATIDRCCSQAENERHMSQVPRTSVLEPRDITTSDSAEVLLSTNKEAIQSKRSTRITSVVPELREIVDQKSIPYHRPRRMRARTTVSQTLDPRVMKNTDATFDGPRRDLPVLPATVEIISHGSALDIVPRLRSKTLDSHVRTRPPIRIHHARPPSEPQETPPDKRQEALEHEEPAVEEESSDLRCSSLNQTSVTTLHSQANALATIYGTNRLPQRDAIVLKKKVVKKDIIGKPVLVSTSVDLSSSCMDLVT